MKTRKLAYCFGSALWCLTMSGAYAASIDLAPGNQNVTVGDAVKVELNMDFTGDPTLGGGVDVFYDSSLLDFTGFNFNAALGDDPAFRRLPNELPNELNGLAFGSFGGLAGPVNVGALTFTALAPGHVDFTMMLNDTPAGGFFSAVTSMPQTVNLTGSALDIHPVPLPAAFWMLLSGLGMLGTLKKVARKDKGKVYA